MCISRWVSTPPVTTGRASAMAAHVRHVGWRWQGGHGVVVVGQSRDGCLRHQAPTRSLPGACQVVLPPTDGSDPRQQFAPGLKPVRPGGRTTPSNIPGLRPAPAQRSSEIPHCADLLPTRARQPARQQEDQDNAARPVPPSTQHSSAATSSPSTTSCSSWSRHYLDGTSTPRRRTSCGPRDQVIEPHRPPIHRRGVWTRSNSSRR